MHQMYSLPRETVGNPDHGVRLSQLILAPFTGTHIYRWDAAMHVHWTDQQVDLLCIPHTGRPHLSRGAIRFDSFAHSPDGAEGQVD